MATEAHWPARTCVGCFLMPKTVAVTMTVTGSNSLAKAIRYLCIYLCRPLCQTAAVTQMVINIYEQLVPLQQTAETEISELITQENVSTKSPKAGLNSPSSDSILHMLCEGLFSQSTECCLLSYTFCGWPAVSLCVCHWEDKGTV